MTREENPSSEVNNNYLSASLEISKGVGGVCLAALRWDNRAVQIEVNLEQTSNKLPSYRTALEFFVDSLPEANKSKYALEQVGMANALWHAINQGSLANHLNELVNHAVSRPILLHVKTEWAEHEIIPWELLSSPNCDFIKSAHITLSVCRSKPLPKHWHLSHSDKIKLLLANSQPMSIRAMHAGEEFRVIQDLLKENRKVEIVTSLDVDYHSFCKSLESQPQILHLACHGLEDKLIFKYEHDKQEIPHTSIVNAIRDTHSIGLVVLNVCHSENLVRQLVESGIPAAIGMSTSITDFAAYEFSRWLYLGLQKGKTVCQAFQSAVENLRNLSKTDCELWSVPVLYENQEFAPFANFPEGARQTVADSPSLVKKDSQKTPSTIKENIIIIPSTFEARSFFEVDIDKDIIEWVNKIRVQPFNCRKDLVDICLSLLSLLKRDNEKIMEDLSIALLENVERRLAYVRNKLNMILEQKHIVQAWDRNWHEFITDIELLLDQHHRDISFSTRAMKKFLDIINNSPQRMKSNLDTLEEQERLYEKYREYSLKYEHFVRRFSNIVEVVRHDSDRQPN
jgi:hypothetical protein